ncbi:MAG: tyrosine-protein phosphatase [Siphonobacter sp.]
MKIVSLLCGVLTSTLTFAQTSDSLLVYAPQRAVILQGSSNFRDLGGYPTKDGHHVKWGHIYRSADISKLTDQDLKVLEEHHLAVICDLRGLTEYQTAPDRIPTGVKRIELPAGSENVNAMQLTQARNKDSLLMQAYTNTSFFKAKYKPVFDELLALDPDDALLFHCTAGKDRTGIGAALVLLALGVDQSLVLKDYEATNVYWKTNRDQIIKQMKQGGMAESTIQGILAANPAYLQSTFQSINQKYGSMEQFLASEMELTPKKLAELRTKYLN